LRILLALLPASLLWQIPLESPILLLLILIQNAQNSLVVADLQRFLVSKSIMMKKTLKSRRKLKLNKNLKRNGREPKKLGKQNKQKR
jgi:hypothetical protein